MWIGGGETDGGYGTPALGVTRCAVDAEGGVRYDRRRAVVGPPTRSDNRLSDLRSGGGRLFATHGDRQKHDGQIEILPSNH